MQEGRNAFQFFRHVHERNLEPLFRKTHDFLLIIGADARMKDVDLIEIFPRRIFSKRAKRHGKEGKIVVVGGKKQRNYPLLRLRRRRGTPFGAHGFSHLRLGGRINASVGFSPARSSQQTDLFLYKLRGSKRYFIHKSILLFHFHTWIAAFRFLSQTGARQSGLFCLDIILSAFRQNFNLLQATASLLGIFAILPRFTSPLSLFSSLPPHKAIE